MGNIHLIDVRENDDFKEGHIPTSRNIPMDILLKEPEKYINKTDEYYIVCQAGVKSEKTCKELWSKGYKVINIKDGTDSYKQPLER